MSAYLLELDLLYPHSHFVFWIREIAVVEEEPYLAISSEWRCMHSSRSDRRRPHQLQPTHAHSPYFCVT